MHHTHHTHTQHTPHHTTSPRHATTPHHTTTPPHHNTPPTHHTTPRHTTPHHTTHTLGSHVNFRRDSCAGSGQCGSHWSSAVRLRIWTLLHEPFVRQFLSCVSMSPDKHRSITVSWLLGSTVDTCAFVSPGGSWSLLFYLYVNVDLGSEVGSPAIWT